MNVVLANITKRFGPLVANNDVSVRFESGRIHGIVGENGAGKSTLMRVLCGVLAPDGGNLVIDGRRYERLTPELAATLGIGMLNQDPLDFAPLAVWENFALSGGRVLGRREARTRLAAVCDRLGFNLPPDVPVARLTVAARQHLELARLFDRDVRLLILDEPTAGIAPAQKDALFAVLRSFIAMGGRSVALVTHKLAETRELCDSVAVLRQGRLAGTFEAPFDTTTLLETMFGADAAALATSCTPPSSDVPQGPPLVRLHATAFGGDTPPLAPVSLDIQPGEIIGLAGVAGGGQETFLRGLAGIAPAVGGSLTLGGDDLTGRPLTDFLKAAVHYLPSSRLEEGLFPGLSLLAHLKLAFPGKRHEAASLFDRRCVGRFRLTNTPKAKSASLSGGNQQRLLLSLVPDDTRLLLADNPTRGLDATSIAQIWAHLRERAAAGAAVVFFSEDLDELLCQAGRVLVFYNGRLAADLPVTACDPVRVGDLMTGRDEPRRPAA